MCFFCKPAHQLLGNEDIYKNKDCAECHKGAGKQRRIFNAQNEFFVNSKGKAFCRKIFVAAEDKRKTQVSDKRVNKLSFIRRMLIFLFVNVLPTAKTFLLLLGLSVCVSPEFFQIGLWQLRETFRKQL